jgi:mannose-6-phosphate isomerase-like protein (cupin superfamily)
MKVINLEQKFSLFNEQWSPKIVGELNGQQVKIAKVHGEFVWHDHADEDELFMVMKGTLKIEFRDRIETIKEGEIIIVPKGVEHRPIAEEEVWIMLFEPKAIKHTGDVQHEMTVAEYGWI